MRIAFHGSFEALTPHEGLQPASDQVGLVDGERCDGHVGSGGWIAGKRRARRYAQRIVQQINVYEDGERRETSGVPLPWTE